MAKLLQGAETRVSRLYFDPGRSRLFESEWTGFGVTRERVFDFSFFTSKLAAQLWYELHNCAFFDNRIERLPSVTQRNVLVARKAGSPKLEHWAAYHPWEFDGWGSGRRRSLMWIEDEDGEITCF